MSQVSSKARGQSLAKSALERAEESLQGASAPAREMPPEHVVAVGDPQAPAERFFALLAHNGVLNQDGWLRSDVHLISMGDHFDYGDFTQRRDAGRAGLLVLAWLAAHPSSQVTILCGNHDLSRVGELLPFDDEVFERAATEGHSLYTRKDDVSHEERAFLERYPSLPSVEVAARDLATFSESQRDLVVDLLRKQRFQLATSVDACLLCHAGVTREHLDAIGVDAPSQSNPALCSEALNLAFYQAVDLWLRHGSTPLNVPHLHVSGSAQSGEGGGILFHRAASDAPKGPANLYQRRFHPSRLPPLPQAIGHVRDRKSRQLLSRWAIDEAGDEGRIRSLTAAGDDIEYSSGVRLSPSGATMLFLDGAMNTTPTTSYELMDVRKLGPFTPLGNGSDRG